MSPVPFRSMASRAPSVRDVRYAANESVHRTSNEQLDHDGTMTCECECHRAECASSFSIARADYEAVRSIGHRFVVAIGHESDDETVVSVTERYLVIDKVGAQAEIADDLDPR